MDLTSDAISGWRPDRFPVSILVGDDQEKEERVEKAEAEVDDDVDDCCFAEEKEGRTPESDIIRRWRPASRRHRVRSSRSDSGTSDIRFIDDSSGVSTPVLSRRPSPSRQETERLRLPPPSGRRIRSSGDASPAANPVDPFELNCYSSLATLSLRSERRTSSCTRSDTGLSPTPTERRNGCHPPSYSADTISHDGPVVPSFPSGPSPLYGAANRPGYYSTSLATSAVPLKSCLVEMDPRGRRVSCSCLASEQPRQLSFQHDHFHAEQSYNQDFIQLTRHVPLSNGHFLYYKVARTKAVEDQQQQPPSRPPPRYPGPFQLQQQQQQPQHQPHPAAHPAVTPTTASATTCTVADGQSQYSVYMESDCRYFFQHPYARFFVAYFVIFCNFLIFAEDPVSHSHTESEIPVVGNVFAFVMTKYPPEWEWRMIKVLLWLAAIATGMAIGKNVIHKWLLARVCRLKMFHEEQGSWMIMFLTVIVSLYVLSNVYNAVLIIAHPTACAYQITARMGITNSSLMKAAACGTWLGDFVTAWMVTDMMLQDNLYPELGARIRAFWRHGNTRIVTFWGGALGASVVVVTLIVSDWINWDRLNRDFVATTELSRAFLASFILVMDLLIVMQDWDFPHFTSTLDINLPGMKVKALKLNFCDCPMNFQRFWKIHITGKWFNYGIIILVMILDLNMWKNQIFYQPEQYGQYLSPDHKIYTVSEHDILVTGNRTLWTYAFRSSHTDPLTNLSLLENDMLMNSRFLGYPLEEKCTAFIPIIIGFFMFGLMVFLYGRFPPKQTDDCGGRLKKRRKNRLQHSGSSWRRERGSFHAPQQQQQQQQQQAAPNINNNNTSIQQVPQQQTVANAENIQQRDTSDNRPADD